MRDAPHARRLFVASCISLVTTAMVFATRGAITGPMTEQFHISNEQIGVGAADTGGQR